VAVYLSPEQRRQYEARNRRLLAAVRFCKFRQTVVELDQPGTDALGDITSECDGHRFQILADLDGTTVRTFLNAEASNYTANNIEGSIGHFWFWPSRLSNRAWSMVAVNLGSMYGWANGAGPHYQIGVASPVEQPRLMREIADLTGTRSALHGYATAHPVTGEVEWSEDGLCCWV
jgi:hypothetical protein